MRIAYDVIMLREQTTVLHPEQLYNATDHHYEKMRVTSIIYTTLTCIVWYCGLNFPIFCILIYSVTLYRTYAGLAIVDKIVQTFLLHKIFCVIIVYIAMSGSLSGHVGLCLDNACHCLIVKLAIFGSSNTYTYKMCAHCMIVKVSLSCHQNFHTSYMYYTGVSTLHWLQWLMDSVMWLYMDSKVYLNILFKVCGM